MTAADPFDLDRFVRAQAGVWEQALAEIRRGRKSSHWMWFVFPQMDGLAHSETARLYAIRSIEEARAYLAHPVLGPRLLEIAEATVNGAEASAARLFGSPDDLKFRSSLTLFHRAMTKEPVFADALARFFGGEADARTEALLARTAGAAPDAV